MSDRFQKFGTLSLHEKLLFCESFFFHLWIGLLLKIIPFRWIPRLFSNPKPDVSAAPDTDKGREPHRGGLHPSIPTPAPPFSVLIQIKATTVRSSMASPWGNKCLVSSLAGRCMLRRRGILSQISLGAAKSASGKTIAHAWLRSGEFEIVAKNGDFHELYSF